MPGLLTSVVRRLGTADDPQTMQSLLVVVAHLARLDTAQLVELLASATGPNGTSTLQAAMEKWTERQIEVRTPYDIRLTTTALGQILLCPHPALDAVVVKGKRLDTGRAIRTRARAATHAEQWSHVPLRVKLVVLLADAYIEAITQANGQSEEEEEWIEEDGSGDEDSGSDFGGGSNGTSSKWGFSGEMGVGRERAKDPLWQLKSIASIREKTPFAYILPAVTLCASTCLLPVEQWIWHLTPVLSSLFCRLWGVDRRRG